VERGWDFSVMMGGDMCDIVKGLPGC
jgi:hypothetical protein